jgi:Tol biopolymer transport system component
LASTFREGRFSDALALCADPKETANDCEASYCELIARTMLWVHDIDGTFVPAFHFGDLSAAGSLTEAQRNTLSNMNGNMETMSNLAGKVLEGGCSYSVPNLPFLLGDDASDPIVSAEIRGTWTQATAAFVGALLDSARYLFNATLKLGDALPPPGDAGGAVPGLPALLKSTYDRLKLNGTTLHAHPTTPADLRGGWYDANQDGVMGTGDQLLVDLFVPGTDQRVFDFSDATPIDHQDLPLGSLVSTAELPKGKCGYKKWHIDTIPLPGIGGSDGVSFSPDGTHIAFPEQEPGGPPQVHVAALDGTGDTCLTCSHTPVGWNDGARFRPNHPDTILFVSTRDHPHSIGGDGGGIGQELYAMRADGSSATRLTTSDGFATNYHANFSHDGDHVVWGNTENRTWSVMVADFVDDAAGMRLENVRSLVRDTTWWETHDFTPDDRRVITTNTRAGLESTDIYAVDIASGALTRLTDHPAWDEHAHLSPDGRVMSWISGRWHPASVWRFADGSLDATYDFFWIVPGIFFNFINPPVGFSTELTLMNNDGTGITELTTDGQVCADNQWSADGTRILFRQSPADLSAPSRIRMVTFDDCQ